MKKKLKFEYQVLFYNHPDNTYQVSASYHISEKDFKKYYKGNEVTFITLVLITGKYMEKIQ